MSGQLTQAQAQALLKRVTKLRTKTEQLLAAEQQSARVSRAFTDLMYRFSPIGKMIIKGGGLR